MYTRSMLVAALLSLLLAAPNAYAQVTANFSADVTASCSPLVVRFTDQSSGNITSWRWSFGNGNVSTQQNPGAVYLQPGQKNVSLIVSDGVDSDTLVMNNFIEVYADPQAELSSNITQGCTPFEVCFNDLSVPGSGGIASWIWDFGDGNSSTDRNPCNVYAQPGSYNVTLLVTDSNGCESQITYPDYIVASDTLKADFEAPIRSACEAPLRVNFINTSVSNSPLSYEWRFGNGRDYVENPSRGYAYAGVYTVSLIITNQFGCTDTMTKTDYVAIEPLDADFEADVVSGCVGVPVQFTDLSTSNPNTWMWYFGDGNTSTDSNPTHTYTAPGTYSVKMVASNSSSCADSITKTSYITIAPSPTAIFSGDQLNACSVPHTVQFTDASLNAVAWEWDFGDGTTSTLQNPAHTYTTDSSFAVSLTVTSPNGCTNTLSLPGYVNIVPPVAALSADTLRGCLPLEVNFSDSSSATGNIIRWQWDFGDGNTSTAANPTHIYTDPGIYNVSLIIENDQGCVDTVVRNNYVRAGNKPNADFTEGTTDICLYGSVTFTDLSQGDVNQWLWQFGDGQASVDENPTYAYSDTGTFTVTLIAISNGCADTLVKPDLMHVSPPDARIFIVQDCATPYEIEYQDNSLAADTWFWNFGDGTTSTDRDPIHTYASRGVYTVSLTVEDTVSGCFDIEAWEVTITDPVADFYADSTVGCHPFEVTFTDTSIDGNTYQWLTDSMTSTQQNPTFTYTTPGVYDVQLIVTDIHGCRDTIVKPDYITVLGPTANFDATPVVGCRPLEVTFTDSSATYNSPIVSYQWLTGTGDTIPGFNPSYTYQQTGSFDVGLIVTDANGCSNQIIKQDYIRPSYPNPAFTADTQSCPTEAVSFTNLSNGNGLSYVWYFGDGDTSHATAPTHLYTSNGVYTVTLVVTDVNGCDSTLVKPDYINISEPEANFYADSTFSPCPPLLVNFSDSSSNDIVAWEWHFGNGETSNLQNPSHVYLHPGSHDVTLITTTAMGCTDTIVKDDFVVVLGPTGTFTFTPVNGCLGSEVEFQAVTQNTAYHTWDFGDGNVVTADDTVTHIYMGTGVHYPALILDDGQGCIYALPSTDSLVVGEMNSNFGASTNFLCNSGYVQFTDSTTAFPPVVSRQWFFGDGDSSTALSPNHYYDQNGTYDVKLVVNNGHCYDTIIKPQYITVERPEADFTISDSVGCLPHKVILEDASVTDSLVVDWRWDFGNGQIDSVQNTTVTYTAAGTYNVQLIITTISGCVDTVVKQVLVNPLPVVNAGVDSAICLMDTIQLEASGASSYIWNPATGLSSDTIADPLANPTNTTEYIVTGTDTNGCFSVDTVLITVNPLPVADAGPDRTICEGESAELNGSGGVAYLWSPAGSLSCDNCSTTIATPATTTDYVLEVVNAFKCVDVDTVTVTVNELPQGIVSNDTTICYGNSVQLSASGGTNYLWVPATGLSCTNCADPVATPDSTTTYELAVTNQFGCSIVDSVTIVVNPNPITTISGDEIICEGAVSQLHATGGVSYQWSPVATLDCSTCADPKASPDTNTTYTVVITNSFGCTVEESITVQVKPVPKVETIADLKLCAGDNITLETTQSYGDKYEWEPAEGLSNHRVLAPVAAPLRTTTYTLTVTNEYGCVETTSVTIEVINKVKVEVDQSFEICYGESVQPVAEVIEVGNEGITWLWNPTNSVSDITIADPILSPESTTEYNLIGFSGSCVPDTHQVLVTVHQLPVITPKNQEPIVEQTSITLGIDGPDNLVSYVWSPDYNLDCATCAEPTLLATQDETYQVTVTDEFGCENTTQVKVPVVGACGDDLFVPNLFTPNRDNVNDKLFVRGRGLVGLKFFRIYDRWGNLVFETNDINEGWNGVYKNKMVDPGVFVYQLEAICSNGFTITHQGNVTLMK